MSMKTIFLFIISILLFGFAFGLPSASAATNAATFSGKWYFSECENDTENLGEINLSLKNGSITGTFSSTLNTILVPAANIDEGTITGSYKNVKNISKLKVKWSGSRSDNGTATITYNKKTRELIWRATPSTTDEIYYLSPKLKLKQKPQECHLNATWRTPENLLDYYYALPERYYRPIESADLAEETLYKQRKKNLYLVDEKNMYLQYLPFPGEGDASMAVFIKPDGSHVIASETRECGPVCLQRFSLLEYVDGEFVDVTDQLLPKVSEETLLQKLRDKNMCELDGRCIDYAFLYELPHRGTTIKIYEQLTFTDLVRLKWKSGKFNLE